MNNWVAKGVVSEVNDSSVEYCDREYMPRTVNKIKPGYDQTTLGCTLSFMSKTKTCRTQNALKHLGRPLQKATNFLVQCIRAWCEVSLA